MQLYCDFYCNLILKYLFWEQSSSESSGTVEKLLSYCKTPGVYPEVSTVQVLAS
jgi:hypothetical protein